MLTEEQLKQLDAKLRNVRYDHKYVEDEGNLATIYEMWVNDVVPSEPNHEESLFLGLYHRSKEQYDTSFTCFLRASVEGNRHAAYHLAHCLRDGLGVRRNLKEAVLWLEKAATSGNVNAMFDLYKWWADNRHESGISEQDARAWLMRSASLGHPSASLIKLRSPPVGLV